MSDAAASRRSVAVQLVRRFPSLLDAIASGTLHLSSLCLLRGHLRAENVDELVTACAGKSARQVEEILARRAPRPDVPTSIHAVPQQAILATAATPTPTPTQGESMRASPAAGRPRVEPLSAERFELRVTISRELRAKLERARDLMRHANVDGDLERVLERAADALLAKLEKQRLAKTHRPQKTVRPSDDGHVAAAVRRAVFERDGERCTYVDDRGKRCTACTLLEIDHIVPRAGGGTDDLENLRVRCRGHNRLWAEECFGKKHIDATIELRRRSLDPERAELARRGLVHLGFQARDAKRAIERVAEHHSSDPTPLTQEEILREALRILT